jgi:hypothetical protein
MNAHYGRVQRDMCEERFAVGGVDPSPTIVIS